MKKIGKIILYIFIGLFFIVILDTIQARIFKNSPFISFRSNLDNSESYVDKGIFMDTYYCTYETDIVTVYWKIKGSKFNCSIDN